MIDEVAEHAMDRSTRLEYIEDEADHRLRLLVGIQRHLARRSSHVPHRQEHAELASTRLGELALEHALLEDMQLSFGHRAFESEQQPVVVVRRIVDPILVRDKGAEHSAHLEELMPVAARAREA